MADVSDALKEHLLTRATTLARCWLITRRDGVKMGFTDHDRDLSFDGVVFEASTGMDGATLESSTGLSVDNGEAVGALSALGLTDEDILAGRYDDAEILHWWVNWQDTSERVLMMRGSLGEIRQQGNAFEVELRGLAERLNRPIGRAFVKTCDRELGDAKCGVDLSNPIYATEAVVGEAVRGSVVVAQGLDAFAPGWFTNGRLTWSSGANAGVVAVVKQDLVIGGVRRLELWEAPALPVAIGDSYRLVAGCDKLAGTCRVKFDNFLNFRGFPHIPGEDWVTAYPRQGDVNAGGTRAWLPNDGS